MHKEIILLATSIKHKNFCVAGVDRHTGDWVRIVSDNPSIDYAVIGSDIRYYDGTFPELLDVIRVGLKPHNPIYYQPENCLINNSYCWEKIGRAQPKEILELIAQDKEDYIFYNNDRRVACSYIKNLNDNEKYSLLAIATNNPIVIVQDWDYKKKVQMNFRYKNSYYYRIAVTDPKFISEYINYLAGEYLIRKQMLLIVSLGENFEGYHYKLISGIINL